MSTGLDPDQDQLYVGPDLDLNCLQRLFAVPDICLLLMFSCPIQQLFNHVKMGLPGLNQN